MMTPTPVRQAVILAGGQGTRLLPLTADRPKPMIELNGRPFIDYLIEMLARQGIERIVLLLGYLPERIQEYCGDGTRYGVAISYRISAIYDDTGRRLRLARDDLDEEFLLLYCDNYWPLDLARLDAAWRASGAPAQVTIYRNADDWTRSNLAVEEGLVTAYDKSRTMAGLQGVDIGFVLLCREVVDMLPADANVSFEGEIYPRLVAERKLAAYVTDHRYYSVGSIERLPVTSAFLAVSKTIFLDRDGTLNRRMGPGEYVCRWNEWEWLPGALEALALLTAAGWRTVVVTNQPGVARQMVSPLDLEDIHARMCADAERVGGRIDAVMTCPHGWDDGCGCRKPAPGMIFDAQHRFNLDLSQAVLIGDDERDGQAALAAGIPYRILSPDERLLDSVQALLSGDWPGPSFQFLKAS